MLSLRGQKKESFTHVGLLNILLDALILFFKTKFLAMQVLTEHKNEVWFVQFSNNGEYLASSSSDCSAIIWKVPLRSHFFNLIILGLSFLLMFTEQTRIH